MEHLRSLSHCGGRAPLTTTGRRQAGEAAEEKARSGADAARSVTDPGLVLLFELSGAGQWQSALFSGGNGLSVALVCAACGAVAGLL